MNRRNFLLISATAAVLPSLGQSAPPKNILFIFMEDMGLQIGPYGDTTAPTPRLDTLAKQGLVFENTHCTRPTCALLIKRNYRFIRR